MPVHPMRNAGAGSIDRSFPTSVSRCLPRPLVPALYLAASAKPAEEERTMGPKLVDYLLYEPEDSCILWIKFKLSGADERPRWNRPGGRHRRKGRGMHASGR